MALATYPVSAPAHTPTVPLWQRLRSALVSTRRPLTADELADLTGTSPANVRSCLGAARRQANNTDLRKDRTADGRALWSLQPLRLARS